jgi:hypothetical protein
MAYSCAIDTSLATTDYRNLWPHGLAGSPSYRMRGDLIVAIPSEALSSFAGGTFNHAPHLCAFFDSPEEAVRYLSSFIEEGLDRGEKVVHIVDPTLLGDYVSLWENAGVPVRNSLATGQFEVVSWNQAYLRTGGFDKFDTLQFIQDTIQQARQDGYSLTRIIGHGDFALSDNKWIDDLIEYESRLEEVLAQYEDPVVCVYDTNQLGAGVALDLLRTHPQAIIGGVFHANPFYVPPAEFLKEIRGISAPNTGG